MRSDSDSKKTDERRIVTDGGEAVAREYINRPDTAQRNRLLRRDYIGGTRPTPTGNRSGPRRFWTRSRLRTMATTYAITGVVGALGAYITTNAMRDMTINGEAMGAPDFWIVFALFVGLAAVVLLGTDYAFYKAGGSP